MKKSLLLTLFLSLILVLAACGGDDSGANADTKKSDKDTTEQSDDNSSLEAEANNEVNITATNFDLGQEEYVVQSGEEVTITLTNEEGHHGISIDEFDVKIDGEGQATFTPEEPGEYKIYCNIMCGEGHGEMVTTLVVV
ncbi:cytochrome C oxidase subunit II [Virgibacillus byunsanensis]|uniref:Cytochrome C oxidase subunit II n=1 Tax=Virgibacillus byunsanensis TaxID=570945 RepID=A0ABW3LIU3_9BACI